MPFALVSTTLRHVPYTRPSGYVYLIDVHGQEIAQRSQFIEPPYKEYDTNPRGGLRGAKGMAVRDDQIAIANASIIFRYDPGWNLLGLISHPSCSMIHDIAFEGDSLWATSASSDLLMQFDFSGKPLRHYYLREPSPALEKLGWKPPILLRPDQIREGWIDFRNPLTHDHQTFDRAHLDSLCLLSNGDILVSLGQVIGSRYAALLQMKSILFKRGLWPAVLSVNRKIISILGLERDLHSDLAIRPAKSKSAVIRISPAGAHSLCLAIPDVTAPSHSLLSMRDGTALYLNTTRGSLIHFDPSAGDVLSSTIVTDGFLRGVTQLADGILLLGSRGELISFDLSRLQIASRMRISADPDEAVFDIKALPSHFSTPPSSFEQHFMRAAGFRAKELAHHHWEISAQ